MLNFLECEVISNLMNVFEFEFQIQIRCTLCSEIFRIQPLAMVLNSDASEKWYVYNNMPNYMF